MSAITRGRTIAAAGILAASTLLGTALAAGPAMQNQGHAAMTHDAKPAPQHEITLTGMSHHAKPAPQHEIILTGMSHDAKPAGMPSE